MRSSIWPGPDQSGHTKAMTSLRQAAREGSTMAARYVAATDAEFDRRSLGIAMALEAARARMARFVAWLERLEACEEGLRFARGCLSPEGAVRLARETDACHVCWLWGFVGPWSMRCPGCVGGSVERFLASPEWASLPWQRDPSEVPHA